MQSRSSLNQVKFQVRYNALLMEKFTAHQLLERTGLKETSVRSELERMKKLGFIASLSFRTESEDSSGKRAGGSRVIYHLNEDPKVRSELAQSIKAFSGARSPAQPISRNYYLACEDIQKAIGNEPHRKDLLAIAHEKLLSAIQEEGGELAPESVRFQLDYELARIAFWDERGQEVEDLFLKLRKAFITLKDYAKVDNIEGFLLCIKGKLYPSNEPPLTRASNLLKAVNENYYLTENPLTTISLQINQLLVQEEEGKGGSGPHIDPFPSEIPLPSWIKKVDDLGFKSLTGIGNGENYLSHHAVNQ